MIDRKQMLEEQFLKTIDTLNSYAVDSEGRTKTLSQIKDLNSMLNDNEKQEEDLKNERIKMITQNDIEERRLKQERRSTFWNILTTFAVSIGYKVWENYRNEKVLNDHTDRMWEAEQTGMLRTSAGRALYNVPGNFLKRLIK